jgi:hypothetical protein
MTATPGPRVWNKNDPAVPAGAVYIGRPSKWGNRFVIGPDGTRLEVIAKDRARILADPELVAKIKRELAGRDLVCFCAPLPCHGDAILQIANNLPERELAPAPAVPQISLF